MEKKLRFFEFLPIITAIFMMFFLISISAAQLDKKENPKQKEFEVFKTNSKIKIDGKLNENIWKNAVKIPLPYEWLPGDNIPAPVKTEFMVTHDQNNLYMAFKCFDPNPDKIRAHLMDRDSIDTFIQDDHVTVLLDTFNDERRGFQFRVNPLGVQADAFFSEMEGYEDFSWDAIWDSAGKITDIGYIVEISIPFHQLRFEKNKKVQTWGFNAERSYPRNVRHRMSSNIRDRNKSCILCQFNKLTGFTGISPGKSIELAPTLTINRTDQRSAFPVGKMESGDSNIEPGITTKWGITPNIIFNGTINPDFSHVEADVAQLEVNERFALRYPEKRPFFLESADMFLTPIEAVFTRTVVDPKWGTKLTGKSGKNAFGFFATQDRINNLVFPANQGSETTSLEEDLFSSVMRYRRDIGKGSALGILYTGRIGENYNNHVAGADGFFRLSKKDTIKVQFLHSETNYPDDIAEKYNQIMNDFGGDAFFAQFVRNSRNWYFGGTFRSFSKTFRADYGFIPRVNIREYSGIIQRDIWGKKNDFYDRISLSITGEKIEDLDGKLTDQELEFGLTYMGPLQSIVFIEYGIEKEYFGGSNYDLQNILTMLEIKPISGVNFNFFLSSGDSIDYTNNRLSDSLLLNPGIELGIGKYININLNHLYEKLSLDDNSIYTAHLSQAKIVYNFNVRMFVRAIIQYLDVDRNTALYTTPIPSETNTLFTQFLFSYKINPQTVLFLGYSDNYLGSYNYDITQTDRTFFFKIGYAWNI